MRHRKAICCLLGLVLVSLPVLSAIPSKPDPQKLVNDYATMLSAKEVQQLENLLVAYDDSTSTQICVVTVNDLGGQDILQAAYEIGEKWGVGHEEHSNGVVLLIKNKTADSGGEMAIATGYGTEGTLTDAICRRIIEQDMVPIFREGNYFQGILQAVSHIQATLSGEDYGQPEDELTSLDIIIILLVIVVIPLILVIMLTRYAKKHPEQFKNNDRHSSGGGGGFWIGGGGHSSGGFSSGGNSFGGFGGGHFGGGGARGGW